MYWTTWPHHPASTHRRPESPSPGGKKAGPGKIALFKRFQGLHEMPGTGLLFGGELPGAQGFSCRQGGELIADSREDHRPRYHP